MKSVIDIFLQGENYSKNTLLKQLNIKEKEVDTLNRKFPDTKQSTKVFNDIAKFFNLSSEEFHNKLQHIKENDTILYSVDTIQELKKCVSNKEDSFYAQAELHDFLIEVIKSSLSESDELAFQLGSLGIGFTETWIISNLLTALGSKSDKEKEYLKQNISRLYSLKFINDNVTLLTLKSLRY